MKYLAILKDSLREAIDTKVFFALALMSILVVLLVASFSYQPVEGETAFQGIVDDQTFHLVYPEKGESSIPQPMFVRTTIHDVTALTEASQPNERDHSFQVTLTDFGPNGFRQAVQAWYDKPELHGKRMHDQPNGAASRVSDEQMAEFLKYQFWMAGNLDVVSLTKVTFVEPDPKANPPVSGQYTFEIKTKGHSGVRGWRHDISVLGLLTLPSGIFQTTLSKSVFFIEDKLIGGFGAWVAVLAGVVITAFYIPNMLRKGTIDMLLSKPIHRTTLLIFKYVGGLTFVFLSSVLAVGGCWLALGLRSGIWAPGFLMMIVVITFFFAILYSISTLFGVLTRSPIVAILATCFIWFMLFIVNTAYQTTAALSREPSIKKEIDDSGWGWIFPTADGVHFVLPRTGDLDVLSAKMLSQVLTEGERKAKHVDMLPNITWGESLGVSFAFIAVMLGLASWRFSRKDF
jgi:ABC-type transport system involved in multi-copper enzyme maturation permease subunit